MKYYLLIVSLFFASVIHAEPVVIFDSGNTVPAYPYKEVILDTKVPDFGRLWSEDQSKIVDKSDDPTDPSNWLPLSSSKLSPGIVKSRAVSFNQLFSPVCIIGSDQDSIDWVNKYIDILKSSNTLCWLVQANDIDDVRKVIQALDGLHLSPANGDVIADFFTIKHYPALITQRIIEQ